MWERAERSYIEAILQSEFGYNQRVFVHKSLDDKLTLLTFPTHDGDTMYGANSAHFKKRSYVATPCSLNCLRLYYLFKMAFELRKQVNNINLY